MTTGFVETVREYTRSLPLTEVVSAAELFARLPSGSRARTTTRLVCVLWMVALAVMVTLAAPPAASAPNSQTIRPPISVQLPCELVTESKMALAGRKFVSTTPVASNGLRFVTTTT